MRDSLGNTIEVSDFVLIPARHAALMQFEVGRITGFDGKRVLLVKIVHGKAVDSHTDLPRRMLAFIPSALVPAEMRAILKG